MYKFLSFAILIFLVGFQANCQEVLSDLSENPLLTRIQQKAGFVSVSSTTLPFFDDFSYDDVFPDQTLWSDNFVFVNNGYPRGPVTTGVATFDAISSNGQIYSKASDSPFEADHLTSNYIDLTKINKDSLYLTFYYQPQGWGNSPEYNDVLMLQFSPQDGAKWDTIWTAHGDTFKNFRQNVLHIDPSRTNDTMEFKQVHLKIDSAKYFTSTFRFRFVNYASIAGSYNPSAAVNCDQWNLDYVYLNRGRTAGDTVFYDAAWVSPSSSILKSYESVPWPHYNEAIKQELNKVDVHFRNNSDREIKIGYIIRFQDVYGGTYIDSFLQGSDNYLPREEFVSRFSLDESPFTYDGKDKVLFRVENELVVDADDFQKGNNKVSYYQHFDNYYAYDDGTAENAYGIDQDGAQLAYQFETYKPDTLRGVSFYFLKPDPVSAGVESFYLCVWDDNNGEPGTLRVKQKGARPVYSDSINEFVNIALDTTILVDGTFYIGWEQTSNRLMNVGFDRNRYSNQKIFFNTLYGWQNSNVIGSLMMRPLLGKSLPETSVKSLKAESKLFLYPNPTSGQFYIQNLETQMNGQILIYNYLGSLVYQNTLNKESFNVSNLSKGVYMVSVRENGKAPISARLIIVN